MSVKPVAVVIAAIAVIGATVALYNTVEEIKLARMMRKIDEFDKDLLSNKKTANV